MDKTVRERLGRVAYEIQLSRHNAFCRELYGYDVDNGSWEELTEEGRKMWGDMAEAVIMDYEQSQQEQVPILSTQE